MKSLFPILITAICLFSACAEEELPPPADTPEPNEYRIHIELTGNNCTLFWQVDTLTKSFDNLNEIVFDTILYGSHYIGAGFYDVSPEVADYYASISFNDVLIGDTLLSNTETVDPILGDIGLFYTE